MLRTHIISYGWFKTECMYARMTRSGLRKHTHTHTHYILWLIQSWVCVRTNDSQRASASLAWSLSFSGLRSDSGCRAPWTFVSLARLLCVKCLCIHPFVLSIHVCVSGCIHVCESVMYVCVCVCVCVCLCMYVRMYVLCVQEFKQDMCTRFWPCVFVCVFMCACMYALTWCACICRIHMGPRDWQENVPSILGQRKQVGT